MPKFLQIEKWVRLAHPMFPEDGPPFPKVFGVRWPWAPERGILGEAFGAKGPPGVIEYTGFKFILRDLADKMGIRKYWWE